MVRSLARSDSAGASHDFAFACRETRIRFSLGYAMQAPVREAILALAEHAWKPAINADGKARDGAWVLCSNRRLRMPSAAQP